MKIIDAHHHYWDPATNYHPWLCDEPPIPFRYGDYSRLRKPFLPEDYAEVTQGWDIVATVTMEGEWNPEDPTGEAIWMQDLQHRTGKPAAHVAQAWLDRGDLEAVLETYEALPIVRSVRHKPTATASPNNGFGGLSDPAFIKGFRRLARYGLMFDLQTPWWHLEEAQNLRDACPTTPIILNHCGLPADRTLEGLTAWHRAMETFAEIPNSFVKISGIGQEGVEWSVDGNRHVVESIINIFGSERCMFASNFPVDNICASFDTIYSGYRKISEPLSSKSQEDLFFNTANRVYQLNLDGLK